MIRTVKIIFCIFCIVICLWACVGKSDIQEYPETNETQTIYCPIGEVFCEGPNWIATLREGPIPNMLTYGYIVFDNEGNEIVDIPYSGAPGFVFIGDNLLRVNTSGGSGIQDTRFFNVEQGLYSPEYRDVQAFDYGWVVYRDWREDEQIFDILLVHDMFDPELNRNIFQRDFRTGTFGDHLLQEARFIDEGTLFIAYVNSHGERVEEMLELR